MLRLLLPLILTSVSSTAQLVERSQPVAQTPRQALVEILQSKDGSAIERHLPEITKKKLRELSNSSATGLGMVMPPGGFSGIARIGSGQKMEVFEAGPVLARMENLRTNEKFEVLIENEDFRGNESDFELAIHMYKNGEETLHWYTPRILLSMKEEAGIWRFAEVGFTIKLPIANPDFLDAMGKQFMFARSAADSTSAPGSLRMLHRAETLYAYKYPTLGYTCSLANLGSGGATPAKGKQPSQTNAMLIDDVLASGRKNGYRFAISNCGSSPASRYTITAVPETGAPGQRAYCTDESGVIRYAADGRAETCLASGKVFQ